MGNSDTDNKVKAILAWYYEERKTLSDEQKLELLGKWIESCTQFEEYEMANALHKERLKLRRMARSRTFLKELKLKLRIIFRKIFK
jgi:hypothetical protein